MLLRAAPWLLAGVPTKAAIPNSTLAKARAALATLQASRAVEDLLSEEPNYEGALCVWALGEAGADAASLQGTSYAAGDGAVLEFLRGGGGGEDYASFVGGSLGDKLSAAAALLVDCLGRGPGRARQARRGRCRVPSIPPPPPVCAPGGPPRLGSLALA